MRDGVTPPNGHSSPGPKPSVGRLDEFVEKLEAIVFEIDVARMAPTYVNPFTSRILGYPVERWIDRPLSWMENTHPDDREQVRDNLERAIRTGEVQRANSRLLTAKGEVVCVAGTLTPIRGEDGRVRAIHGVLIDITEQRKAQEHCEFMKSVLESAASPIMIADREGVISWVNDGFTRLTGYTREEMIGKTPRILKSGTHGPDFYRGLWKALLAGNVWHGEIVNRRKDGTLYTEEQTVTPVRGADGQVSHFVAIKQDVTEKKRLEAQFRQSQKMEAVGQLAGGVAHDFNNLLLVMNGYCEMALGKLPEDHPQRGDLLQVLKAGARAKDLTRQLLAFSRRQVLDPKVIDLNEVVCGMEKMLVRLLPEHTRVVSDLSSDLGRVLADRGQVEQVVMNLVVNARDAMPDGGKVALVTRNVEIDAAYAEAHPGTPPGRYVLLSIADTGCGMSQEVLSHLFEPFFTTKRAGKGTGLGLSTVYGIVRQSGGSIDVFSDPDRGTRFDVFLPRAEAPDEPIAAEEVAASLLGRGSVLLVEDEPEVRSVVRRFLEVYGYDVTEAKDGQEGLEIAERSPRKFDLLLSDIVMPRLGGKALATRLAWARPDLRVILMTGYTDDAGLRQGDLPEGWSLLQKPFTSRALAERLRDALRPRAPFA
ncbi:MAG: PAS domain S-box protein [Planctomycetota bacterium]